MNPQPDKRDRSQSEPESSLPPIASGNPENFQEQNLAELLLGRKVSKGREQHADAWLLGDDNSTLLSNPEASDTDISVAAKALSALSGVPETETIRLIHIIDRSPFWPYFSEAGDLILKGPDKSRMDRMQQSLKVVDTWLNWVKDNPAFIGLATRELTQRQASRALSKSRRELGLDTVGRGLLRSIGSRFLPGDFVAAYDVLGPGADVYYSTLAMTQKFVSDYPQCKVEEGHTLLSHMRKLNKLGGTPLVSRYLGILRNSAEEFLPPDDSFSNKSAKEFELISTAIRLAPEIDFLVEAYGSIKARGGLDLLEFHPVAKKKTIETESEIIGRISVLTRAASGKALTNIFAQVEPEFVGDYEEVFSNHPELFELFKTVKKHGVSAAQFTEFLFDTSFTQIPAPNHGSVTVLQYITQIASIRSQGPAAAYLMGAGLELLTGEHSLEVQALSRRNREAQHVLPMFREQLVAGNDNKAKALVAAGLIDDTAASARSLRPNLQSLSESQLGFSSEYSLPDQAKELYQRVLDELPELASPQQTPPLSKKGKVQEPISWFDVLKKEIEAVPNLSMSALTQAHERLPDSLQGRLRSVWHRAPESMGSFVRFVNAHSDKEGFNQLLSDRPLFKKFIRLLDEKSSAVKEIADLLQFSEQENLFREIRLVVDRALDSKKAEPADSGPDAQSAPEVEPFEYSRVIIWGGQYSDTKRSRIEAAAKGFDIEIFDMFNYHSDASNLGPDDLIVWNTTSNNHSDHFKIKRQCETTGAGFMYFTKSGISPMLDLLQDFSDRKA